MSSAAPNLLPLEPLGIKEHKLSGTSFILRDIHKEFIYKVVPTYSATEAIFYSVAYRMNTPLDGLRGNDIKREDFKDLNFLVDNEIIPFFNGVVPLSHNIELSDQHTWYEIQSGKVTQICKAIKLENLLLGFEKPAVIDIKLGGHNINYDFNYGNLSEEDRLMFIEHWRNLKHTYRKAIINREPMSKQTFDISASDLGLPEQFDSLDRYSLHTLLKTWRQKQVASETTELELGFRISSIYIHDPLYKITSSEAKKLNSSEATHILQRIFSDRLNLQKCLLHTLKLLRDWISIQNSISVVASSILITFDQLNDNLCKAKWVDFAHVDAEKSIVFENHQPSNMMRGIDNLVRIIEKAKG
ncbi:conserved hypothetical protein [Theileria equi strain WA]|uniref:Kinase n=1 Tax=Theileria equi strain WA TaxID=1537102 RepID=L1LDI2_THEEQ|nr:conserved hypothetical protein [Theileria equi strain WA]EKX73324.1 conserved hypothetical protein [Theileria equi strain WA]|eukprot:XP_004832776.1 conserved hypothetical protein [Theileria equi strain WA]